MNIRLGTVVDVKMLTALFNSDRNIFGEDKTGFGEKDLEEYVLDKKKKIFVYEIDNKVVGALMADYHETYSHLETLIVHKNYHQQGIGSALFDFYENDLSETGIPLIEVLTETNNHIMQKFLEKRGFREGNTFKFYSKGE